MRLRLIGSLHKSLVFNRRRSVLARMLADQLAGNDSILDVGSGDGSLALELGTRLGDVKVTGIDVFVRPDTAIEITEFDGSTIPFDDNSVDAVTFVDVLHHTDDPAGLLAEAARVSRNCVVIKDHLQESLFDRLTLRFMDWIGNAPHGVVLPYNYASRKTWDSWFDAADLKNLALTKDVPLYPWPFSLLFGRSLHFIARLEPAESTLTATPALPPEPTPL